MPPWGLTWKGPVIFLQQTQGRDSWRPWWKVRWKATWRGAVSGEGVRTFLEDGFHMEVIMTYTPGTAPIKQHQMKKLLRQPHSTEYFVNLAGRKKSSFHHQAHIPSVQFALLWNQKYGMQKALQSKRMLLTSCLDILLGNMLIVLFTTSSETGQKTTGDIICCITDSMDKSKFSLPRYQRGQAPKDVATVDRPSLEVTTTLVHGVGVFTYLGDENQTAGTNWVLKTLTRSLQHTWIFFSETIEAATWGFEDVLRTIHPKNLCLPWSLLFLCLYCLLSGVVRRFWPYFIPVPDSHGLRK